MENALTDEFPDGDAKKAWENLTEIFEPTTMSNKVALSREFINNVLKDVNKNPDTWIDELETLQKRLWKVNGKKTDEELIMHILNGLPKEHDT